MSVSCILKRQHGFIKSSLRVVLGIMSIQKQFEYCVELGIMSIQNILNIVLNQA